MIGKREPQYNPEALRENAKTVERSIARIQEAINKFLEENIRIREKTERNNKDIQIFTTEIGKLEQEKTQLIGLAEKIERLRGYGNVPL